MKQHARPTYKKLLLLAGLLLILVGLILLLLNQYAKSRQFGVLSEDILIVPGDEELSADTMIITKDRIEYQRGSIALVIPALDLSCTVGESTDPAVLRQMPGMYEFSQLPGEGDVNVSIAGHRDVHGREFYSLDALEKGDYLYLIYNDTVYRYLYKQTLIVTPDRWDLIGRQGFSCLTLTTCDPIGTTLNRLIVQAELVDTEPYRIENDFPERAA